MTRTRPITFALLLALPLALGCDAPDEGDAEEVRSETPAGGDPKNVPQLEAVRVETAQVAETKSSFRIVRPGEVEPKRDANVASAMGGLVEAVAVKTGEVVKSGAPWPVSTRACTPPKRSSPRWRSTMPSAS